MQPGSQDINVERVETLKQAIRSGQLTMDTGKIADALLKTWRMSLRIINRNKDTWWWKVYKPIWTSSWICSNR